MIGAVRSNQSLAALEVNHRQCSPAFGQLLVTHRCRRLKSAVFLSPLDCADERHCPTHSLPRPRRVRSTGWLRLLDSQRSGGQTAPKTVSNKGLHPPSPRPRSCRFLVRGPLRLSAQQVCYLRFVGSGLSPGAGNPKNAKNAQLYANWPFLRILAQSRLWCRNDGPEMPLDPRAAEGRS